MLSTGIIGNDHAFFRLSLSARRITTTSRNTLGPLLWTGGLQAKVQFSHDEMELVVTQDGQMALKIGLISPLSIHAMLIEFGDAPLSFCNF